jgi:Fic family protein
MAQYNWQHPHWPQFEFTTEHLTDSLYTYAKDMGRLVGILKGLDSDITREVVLERMVEEALSTSKIEGEHFNPEDIRSSIRNYLRIDPNPLKVQDARAFGVSKLMGLLHQHYDEDLTESRLLQWHQVLFEHPTYGALQRGCWRTNPEPMQIISGPIGHEKVYFEAPPAHGVPAEMARFIEWFNDATTRQLAGPVRAAIAHLYFESIHPFEDGNGRIGRAISELALSQDMQYPCVLSLSKAIQQTQKQYYQQLSAASTDGVEVTEWVTYFIHMVLQAQQAADLDIQFVLKKARFWRTYGDVLNDRQQTVIRRMFKEGRKGFEGGMSAKKYEALTGCSKATATRDLAELLILNCFTKLEFGGRSTAYALNLGD